MNDSNDYHNNKTDQDGSLVSPLDALNVDITKLDIQQSMSNNELTDSLSSTVDEDNTLDTSYERQGFLVGELNMMIGYADGSKLIDMPNIHHVPNSPNWFLGVVNVHGVVIPIFNLAVFINQPSKPIESSQRVMVIGHGADAVAIPIDSLPQRIKWNKQHIVEKHTAPNQLLPYLNQACLIDGRLWFDLDSASVCDAFEHALHH